MLVDTALLVAAVAEIAEESLTFSDKLELEALGCFGGCEVVIKVIGCNDGSTGAKHKSMTLMIVLHDWLTCR